MAEVSSADEFWDEIEDVVSTPCRTHDRIDDTLRTWLGMVRSEYVRDEEDLGLCVRKLLEGELFARQHEYVRRQLVYGLLQEDDAVVMHLLVVFLLQDGRNDETSLELLAKEGGFPRLVELISDEKDDEIGLHRALLVLLYEMSRIQRIPWADLATADDAFVLYLLEMIESISRDVQDAYYAPVIRVLLVLNEQYMIAESAITNRVLKMLSTGRYKGFGESTILLLNRERETSLQMLVLKLFFLVFTNPATCEYFYTNDLHVLIDIIIRNLPESGETLRHSYLRVLHPLLTRTQLSQPPHYKADALRWTLKSVQDGHFHFDQPDETTVRLVARCLAISWLRRPAPPPPT